MDAEATALYDAIDAIVSKATFNGVSLLGTGPVELSIGVTDDGGAVTLTTGETITAVTSYTTASAADTTADNTLQEVALSLGNVAAGIAALKGRQAVAYAASANLAAAAARTGCPTPGNP